VAEAPVEALLGTDPADLAAWLPVVEDGGRVLLPALPGARALVREAVACGVVALVPDDAPEQDVATARTALASREVDPDDVAALLVVLRDRLRRGAGARPDPRTAPTVVLLAFGRGELRRLHRAGLRLEDWGATAWTVVSDAAARGAPALVPTCGPVVRVPDPASSWWPARAERLLVLLAPRVLTGGLRRGTRLLASRAPGPARPALARAVPAVEVLDQRRRTVSTRVHEGAWTALMRRLKPALVARRVVPLLPALVGDLDDLDLVCGPGADSRTVAWQLLREHPSVTDDTSASEESVAAAVRARTRSLAASLAGEEHVP
jgi:hypothetical protein